LESEICKFKIEISVHPSGVIQISMDSLFQYLSYGTGPMQNRSLLQFSLQQQMTVAVAAASGWQFRFSHNGAV
jgi:hypothetical protein